MSYSRSYSSFRDVSAIHQRYRPDYWHRARPRMPAALSLRPTARFAMVPTVMAAASAEKEWFHRLPILRYHHGRTRQARLKCILSSEMECPARRCSHGQCSMTGKSGMWWPIFTHSKATEFVSRCSFARSLVEGDDDAKQSVALVVRAVCGGRSARRRCHHCEH